ncbi:hypothetical protein BJ138DRAFT_1105055 [Hygrophoropsis aurantiaca]|uniref:Uncharacterized protein n=1 Tax=Hygrophoropsis aurantiaca TaxID=72124 RepID=A0ACB7ZZF5_9AGAM|nr:hypothetical protein BJ138DRAFT_1105055 [Hygrophoropsis aurantiaca]
MKMLYGDHVKPLVRAGIESGIYSSKGEKLMAVRKLTASALEQAGSDMLAAIESHKLEIKKKQKIEDDEGVQSTRTNAEYVKGVRAQEDFPIVAGQFCEVMGHLTGCSFSIYMGGPDPRLDGEVNVVSYHTGTALESNINFATATPDFDECFTKPLSDFLETVYPHPVRKMHALGYVPQTPTASSIPGEPEASSSAFLASSDDSAASAGDTNILALPSQSISALTRWMVSNLPIFDAENSGRSEAHKFVPHIPTTVSWPPLVDMDPLPEFSPDFVDTDEHDLPHLQYSFSLSSSLSTTTTSASQAPDTPITAFRKESSSFNPVLSPPRLRYSLGKPNTSTGDLPLGLSTVYQDLFSASSAPNPGHATFGLISGSDDTLVNPGSDDSRASVAIVNNNTKPKLCATYRKTSNYDTLFNSPPRSQHTEPATLIGVVNNKPLAGATRAPIVESNVPAPSNSLTLPSISAKRKRLQVEAESIRRRSSRTVVPSSRQEEANKIDETKKRKKGGARLMFKLAVLISYY